uniref:ComF family protein n=1 Tax=Thaumasiovibrio occultus TaxID=1891184 RepID=UPI000B362ADD|nr:ComF family protein [Thaumasiovibrio occultus]
MPHCQRCGLLAAGNPTQCGRCLSEPPLWQQLTAISHYAFPLDRLVAQFKQHQPGLAKPLAQWLAAKIDSPAELLLPVPMHWRRRLERGYNQSDLLAHELGKQLRIPVARHWLKRTQHTAPQQTLARKARLSNVKTAFMANAPPQPLPRHVAIVDDIVTTGTTVATLCKLLSKQKIERIDIYCLCRTPPPK